MLALVSQTEMTDRRNLVRFSSGNDLGLGSAGSSAGEPSFANLGVMEYLEAASRLQRDRLRLLVLCVLNGNASPDSNEGNHFGPPNGPKISVLWWSSACLSKNEIFTALRWLCRNSKCFKPNRQIRPTAFRRQVQLSYNFRIQEHWMN